MGRPDTPFNPEISELLSRYAQEALSKFLDADKAEKDKICADLEALAAYEGMDIKTALKSRHRELLLHIEAHRQDLRE